MSIKDEFRRPISQVITFLGSNRPLVVDGVTAEPALARKVCRESNAWNNKPASRADSYDRFVGRLTLFTGSGPLPKSYLPVGRPNHVAQ